MTAGHNPFWQRLTEAMHEKYIATGDKRYKPSQVAAGALIGSKGNTAARKWQREHGLPSMANALTLAQKLDVCVEWLLTGRGAKYPAEGVQTPTEARILALWRTFSPAVKWHVFGQMETADMTRGLIELRVNQTLSESDVDARIADNLTETGEFKALKRPT